MLHLGAGDDAAYRRLCARIRDRDPNLSRGRDTELGWMFVAAPGGISDPARALPLIDTEALDRPVWTAFRPTMRWRWRSIGAAGSRRRSGRSTGGTAADPIFG